MNDKSMSNSRVISNADSTGNSNRNVGRIDYLDLTKCFAILCVLMGHVWQWSYPGNPYEDSTLFQGIYAFLIGLLLAWLVEKTDTLLPSIILHIAINGSAFLYPIIFSGVKKTALNYWIMFGLSLAICVISFFLYIAGKKKILPPPM